MNHTYTVFVATNELYTSPMIAMVQRWHDIALVVGQKQTVMLSVPQCCKPDTALLQFDPDMLDLISAVMDESGDLKLTVFARDIGSTNLVISAEPAIAKNGKKTLTAAVTKPTPNLEPISN